MDEFKRSLDKVLVHEGGYVNDPQDPGGATNRGITQAVYDDYRRTMRLATQPVKMLTTAECESIYRMRYWALVKGDMLPVGVSYVVFDGAVNSGVGQSVKWLQRAIGVPADGVIGPQTINAVRAYGDQPELVSRICDQRLAFLRALKTFRRFGKGWTTRVNEVRATAQAWIIQEEPERQPTPFMGTAKGKATDAKAAPSAAIGDAAASAGGASAFISQSLDKLSPLQGNDLVNKIIITLTIAGIVIGAAGIIYGVYARRRKAELAEVIGAAHA